ncbi:GYF domain-containing protein [Kaistia dalseonensis]|uniref:TM2 domain-containing membrane protein YozV n=1 Tax=Kaistia dalseonensis TaxID=410840 RepID=A0ABU0HBR1_9HYPH|nr:GYF domain-containing protein [Kaistia dalseonensis]MCX5497117.1 GYF domain-containing protein [Kaistia dalseonensis]MDQ0439743.1 TM2 domain-containing membrane protein YozV [Kaistia dalseonensis]
MTNLVAPDSLNHSVSGGADGPPPHPLDRRWYISYEGKNYGPYPGHDFGRFLSEQRVSENTQVIAEDGTTWSTLKDDPILGRLLTKSASPLPPSQVIPDHRVSAAEGSTVVQVTNLIGQQPSNVAAVLLDGPAANKSAGVALLLSLLCAGLGQFYNGQVGKGILMFIMMVALWFVFLGWIVWIWSAVDAYRTAKAMNLRYHMILTGGAPIGYRG